MSRNFNYASVALLVSSLVAGSAVSHAAGSTKAVVAPPKASAPAAISDADRDLLEKHCSSCHGVDQVTAANKNAADWAETMDRMIDHGMQISPEDNKKIQDFLVAHYGPK